MPATPQKYSLDELISMMEPTHAHASRQILKDYSQVITTIPGSSTKHQAWPGGYVAHVEEAMNIAIALYGSLNARRKLDFSLSSALFCLFLHDFDKVQRYEMTPEGVLRSKGAYSKDYLAKTQAVLSSTYDYTLTDEEFNALKYAHGEGGDYHPTDRVIMPLGTLVHCCDIISARIWYDNGKSHTSWND